LPFLFSAGVPTRWLGISAAMFASVSLLIYGIQLAMAGGMAAAAGMCFFAVGGALTMIACSTAFSVFLTIIAESSEGVKQIQSWPNIFDWFGHFFAFAVAAILSAFPGWLVAHLLPHDEMLVTTVISIGVVVSFPIIVLSQLDIGSIWGVLSPKVLKSVLRCPFSWMTFYVETGAVAAVCIASTLFAIENGWNPVMIAAPLGTAASFLYARLLGRLGWLLAEKLPE